jgi:hypothetical protein
MFGDPKKMASAILGKSMKPAPEEEESDEIQPGEGLEAAALDFKAAFEKGDAKGIAEALKAFVEQCE